MPNSVLWVCLVAVWLFVLVPMVIKGRPQMRKTTDAVKETRLLHRGGTRTRTTRRRASGSHPHDPSWKADRTKRSTTSARTAVLDRDETDDTDTDATVSETENPTRTTRVSKATGAAVKAPTVDDVDSDDDAETPRVDADDERDSDIPDEVTAESDPDLDAADDDAADDDAADDDEVTVDGEFVDPEREDVEDELDDVEDAEIAEIALVDDIDEADDSEDIEDDADLEDEYDDSDDDVEYADDEYEADDYEADDEYYDDVDEYDVDEYDDDLEDDDYEDEPAVAKEEGPTKPSMTERSAPRRRIAHSPDAQRIQLRYRERQRVMLGMIILFIAALASGIFLGLTGWIAAGVVGVVLFTYLAYLRRTAATEQKIRAQRAARARRAEREQAERRRRQQAVPEFASAPPPQRLRRPGGATVLELDDEDPVFDHLPPFQRRRMMREDGELRRVAG
ncbi:gephyrin-like molybdotransferase receptor GlpR [Gordonia sp. DT101]|uniref:divisome protein SepX/GlpR n=1 Tax=Gordonia sp. DT101 TaxID=3416545 RepID=UPI003CF3578C